MMGTAIDIFGFAITDRHGAFRQAPEAAGRVASRPALAQMNESSTFG